MSKRPDAAIFPTSPWSDLAPPSAGFAALPGDLSVDVLIIGGGFTGLSTALHLAEQGVQPALIEAQTIGFGASGRNGGQVIPGLKHDPDEIVAGFGPERGEAIVDFVGAAPSRLFDIVARYAIDCAAHQAGWLQGVHHRSALAAVERRAQAWRSRGVPVDVLTSTETERRTGSPVYCAGYFDPRGGTVNPLALARGLALAAASRGAAIYQQTPASDLQRVGQSWRVTTPKGTITAARVLLATNAYTGALWPSLDRSMIPLYSYQVATQPLSDNLRATLVPNGLGLSETRRLLYYARQDAAGRLLVGGRGRHIERPDSEDFKPVIKGLQLLFPALETPALSFRWSGLLAVTRDHLPHIGEVAPGLSAAMCYNGRGVALTTALGAPLARHLCGEALDALPVPSRPIRPLPFARLRGLMRALAIAGNRLQDWRESG